MNELFQGYNNSDRCRLPMLIADSTDCLLFEIENALIGQLDNLH